MATDLKLKVVNEVSRMSDIGYPFAVALPVVLDAYFEVDQNGEKISKLVANKIKIGGAGNIVLESPYTLNNVPVVSYIRGCIAGEIIAGVFQRVLTTHALGTTTATNLTWMSGE